MKAYADRHFAEFMLFNLLRQGAVERSPDSWLRSRLSRLSNQGRQVIRLVWLREPLQPYYESGKRIAFVCFRIRIV